MSDDQSIVDWMHRNLATAPSKQLGEGYQARVTAFDTPYGQVVVKEAHRDWLLGRASVIRESKIYQRLQSIPGIPRYFGLLSGEHLVLEFVPGLSLRAAEAELVDRDAFFASMLATLKAMHAEGVAHGDLKRKDNTIVGPQNQPYLIDFGVACLRKQAIAPFNKIWFKWAKQMDYNAWVKLKYGRKPRGMTAEDAALYKPLWLERIARWIRVPWQKLTFRRWRKRRKNVGLQ